MDWNEKITLNKIKQEIKESWPVAAIGIAVMLVIKLWGSDITQSAKTTFEDQATTSAKSTVIGKVYDDFGLFKDQALFDSVLKTDRGVVILVEMKADGITKKPLNTPEWILYCVIRDQKYDVFVANATGKSIIYENKPSSEKINEFASSCGII